MPPLENMGKRMRDSLIADYPFTVRAMCRKGMSLDYTIGGLQYFFYHNEVREDLGLLPAKTDSAINSCMSECEVELRARFYKDLRG